MKIRLLLFLAFASAAHAITYVGDRMVVPPFDRNDGANFVGMVTLARPGVYRAADWNVVGQVRLAAPGDYTVVATSGGINFVGQLIGPNGPATLHVKYARGTNFVAGTIDRNVTVLDESSPLSGLPAWLRTFTVAVGDSFVYSPPVVVAGGCQWRRNGEVMPGATEPTLTQPCVQPIDAGIYTLEVTEAGGTRTIAAAVVAIRSPVKITGDAIEVTADVLHPNGVRYDQWLMTGASATLTADPGQVTRISFLDLTDDIVQVEFSGAGSLTIALSNASGPDLPVNYHQSVRYMKGHATILVADADSTTNVSVFSVGRANAVNRSVFKEGVVYDGVADIAALVVQSASGRAGGLFLGNAHFFAASGMTGVFAAGIQVAGPVRIGNVSAFDQAMPVLVFGHAAEVCIAGGDLWQDNGRAVEVWGIGGVCLAAGSKSNGEILLALPNLGKLISDGVDVTGVLIEPGP
ncbi:hypothetical protein [Opitutus terrae]|uniref:MBG domain-containing protein n=1 Tax=Opitutus terrae (strain DSM 11246 / JCM 15787 / PB90-1) TaxID=452637 RepID=B1ZTJ6_OPITP|nr:hypothetical protein [Opitutus terrae]ACB73941.1 hypothetical protein Oter_0651 [Opitutus terrae PB90-1]